MEDIDLNTDNDFWRYSLACYGRPGVEALCLELQDQWGGNVNLLLWACWLDSQDIALTEDLLDLAVDKIKAWDQQVVEPLRRLRRQLKVLSNWSDAEVQATRSRVKQAELEAEKQEQDWLYHLVLDQQHSPDEIEVEPDVKSNLSVYLAHVGMLEKSAWVESWRAVMS